MVILRILRVIVGGGELMPHYEVRWPGGDLLGIYPTRRGALARAWPWWDRGVRVVVRYCRPVVLPSALTMSAAARSLKSIEEFELE